MAKQTTRRAVLAGTAAAALTTGAAANVSAVCDSYADLAKEWRAVTATIDENWRQYKEWSAETDRLFPPPETLRVMPCDAEFCFDPPLPEGSTHYRAGFMQQFAGAMCHPLEIKSSVGTLTLWHGDKPWPKKQARADAIMECWSEWNAKREAHMASLGYVSETDEEETNERSDRLHDAEQAIDEAPVNTIADALAKVKLIAEIASWYDVQDGLNPTDEDGFVDPPGRMARKLLNQIAAMA